MRRATFLTLTLFGAASAASFAGFSIKPYGDQKLNLQTGVTILSKGGVASDAARGVTVDAQYIEYKQDDRLTARDAKLSTKDGGVLVGKTVEYNAKSGVLVATGDLEYNDARVKGLTAPSISLDTNRKLAVATGGVKSETNGLSANTVVVDYAQNRAVMYGNYVYNYNGTRLKGSKADSVLFVTWNADGKASTNSKPTAEQLKPYQTYLK